MSLEISEAASSIATTDAPRFGWICQRRRQAVQLRSSLCRVRISDAFRLCLNAQDEIEAREFGLAVKGRLSQSGFKRLFMMVLGGQSR